MAELERMLDDVRSFYAKKLRAAEVCHPLVVFKSIELKLKAWPNQPSYYAQSLTSLILA